MNFIALIVAVAVPLLVSLTVSLRKYRNGLSMEERFKRHRANMAAIDEAGRRREAARVAANKRYVVWVKQLIRETEKAGVKPVPVPFTPDLSTWRDTSTPTYLAYDSAHPEDQGLSMDENGWDDAVKPFGHGSMVGGVDLKDLTTYI